MLFVEASIWVAYAICQSYINLLVSQLVTALISLSTVCLYMYLWRKQQKKLQAQAVETSTPRSGAPKKGTEPDTPHTQTQENLKPSCEDKAKIDVKVENDNKLNNSV